MKFRLIENFIELLEESAKTDFVDKFGQETLNNFDKAKQRLKNNGYSTDYGQYLKMSEDELDELILSLYDDKKDAQKKRIIQGTDKEIRGKYNYLGEYGGYKIYEPLDVQASMDLGVNTGWCTTGRYGHYGHPEFTPSIEDARRHWDDYIKRGIKFYYLLDPKTMYGEYAVAVYPKSIKANKRVGDYYVHSTNFEIYNAEDDIDYSAVSKIPIDKIPNTELDGYKIEITELPNTVKPVSLDLLSIEEAEKLPKSVRLYDKYWWLRSSAYPSFYASYVEDYDGSVHLNGFGVDYNLAVRPVLTVSNLDSSNLKLYGLYKIFKYGWIYIGDNRFLYNSMVITHEFDEKSNNYEKSSIKQFLNIWLKDLQSKSVKESLKRKNRMKFKLVERYSDDANILPAKVRKELNTICNKYNGWKLPQEIAPLWDELYDKGVEVLIQGSPSKVAEDGGKMWEVPFDYNGERCDNSYLIYCVYEGSNRSLRNEYLIYFS